MTNVVPEDPLGVCVVVAADRDIVEARVQGRVLAEQLGFSPCESTLIATAISELARNIVIYAEIGEIKVGPVNSGEQRGLMIVARDRGPGIADVAQALREGYSTSGGYGLGLPGLRRIMDDCKISSVVGKGTTVVAIKWQRY